MVKEVKCNFKTMHNTLICQSCLKHECTQEHLLSCEKLIGSNELLTYIPKYFEIWEGSFEEKLYIAQLMLENLRRKRKIENIL